jgi:Na+/H+ antiporter
MIAPARRRSNPRAPDRLARAKAGYPQRVTDVEVFVFLLALVAVLAGVGLRYGLPYPVLLLLGGLAVGLVPGVPAPDLDPDLVFFVFLPPLLYFAAFSASAYELRANARPITLLAIGLVTVTVFAVAAAAHWLLGIPWVAAFVLGGVLGPTDPVSASAVIRRLGASARIETILEGESLVNDGTGITAYRLATGAVGAAAAASPGHIVLEFLAVAAGGIAIGVAVGWVFGRLRGMVREPAIDVSLSVLIPFAAYIPAEHLHVSGVLAAVAAGVWVGTRSLQLVEAGTRLRTFAFWEALNFILNGLLFLLIGLQLPHVISAIEGADALTLAWQALLITAVTLGVRGAWMFLVPGAFHALAPFAKVSPPATAAKERIVLAWSGMRGGVSLAAALAMPPNTPERDLVLFLAYAVVVLSLVGPGLTLAPLVRRLGLSETEQRRREDAEARLRLAHAGLERLEEIARSDHHDGPRDRVVQRLRERYQARLERLEARLDEQEDDGRGIDHKQAAELQASMLEAERDVLRGMQQERAVTAELLRELERELDLDESRLQARGRA